MIKVPLSPVRLTQWKTGGQFDRADCLTGGGFGSLSISSDQVGISWSLKRGYLRYVRI